MTVFRTVLRLFPTFVTSYIKDVLTTGFALQAIAVVADARPHIDHELAWVRQWASLGSEPGPWGASMIEHDGIYEWLRFPTF